MIDEAHNLVERGREMYSASLCKEEILRVKRQVKHIDVRLTKRLEECNRQLLELKRNCDGVTVLDSVMHIYLKLLSLMAEMERFLEDYKPEQIIAGNGCEYQIYHARRDDVPTVCRISL